MVVAVVVVATRNHTPQSQIIKATKVRTQGRNLSGTKEDHTLAVAQVVPHSQGITD